MLQNIDILPKIKLSKPKEFNARDTQSSILSRRIDGLFGLSDVLVRLNSHGFRPTGLKIRKMKSKWGSCSTKGSITLNNQLARLERACSHRTGWVAMPCYNQKAFLFEILRGKLPQARLLQKELAVLLDIL